MTYMFISNDQKNQAPWILSHNGGPDKREINALQKLNFKCPLEDRQKIFHEGGTSIFMQEAFTKHFFSIPGMILGSQK